MAGIERHEALKNLSRHHHHALVVAMNLNRATGADEAGDEKDRLRQLLIDFWDGGGNEHFREEEEVLLPMYAKYKDIKSDADVSRMLLEHVQIRMLVQAVRGGQGKVDVYHQLGALLKAHVQFEEQTVFAAIQDTVPEPDLFAIAHFFHEM